MEDMALKRASSSPHIHAGRTVQGLMLEVIVALVPAGAFGIWYFGWRALLIIAVSVLSAVFWEWLYGRVAKKPCTVGDLSAVVTGILLAYNLPSSVPVWMPVIGTLLAIVLVKMLFGGLGANFRQPGADRPRHPHDLVGGLHVRQRLSGGGARRGRISAPRRWPRRKITNSGSSSSASAPAASAKWGAWPSSWAAST